MLKYVLFLGSVGCAAVMAFGNRQACYLSPGAASPSIASSEVIGLAPCCSGSASEIDAACGPSTANAPCCNKPKQSNAGCPCGACEANCNCCSGGDCSCADCGCSECGCSK